GRLWPTSLPKWEDASGVPTHALRLVMPAIGAGPGVLAQRSGAWALWATGEPILVYRRAANEPSPALAAAQRQSKVRVPADGPLRDARKGHWSTFSPLSLRLPANSGSPVARPRRSAPSWTSATAPGDRPYWRQFRRAVAGGSTDRCAVTQTHWCVTAGRARSGTRDGRGRCVAAPHRSLQARPRRRTRRPRTATCGGRP